MEIVILLDGVGNVIEGLGFNVFFVKGGCLIIVDVGVLEGISC